MNKTEFIEKYAVARQNTNSAKWDGLKSQFGQDDLLPLWVADTEFKAPQAVIDAMQARISHGAFGYSFAPDSYYHAYINWQKERYGIEVHQEWMRLGPGVVNALATLVQTLTQENDAVMVLQPVYYPFMNVIENNHRKLVVSELQVDDQANYSFNYQDIETKIKENHVKLLILCSPHNPVGRVWDEAELEQLLALCQANQVWVISDEIHHDLIVGDKPFVSTLSIADGRYRDIMVMVDAPSKTFNLAALNNCHVVIPNPQLRDHFDQQVAKEVLPAGSLLGHVAGQAAYEKGAEWLDNMLAVIKDNFDYVKDQLTQVFPEIKVSPLQGTYLMWVDLSTLVAPGDIEVFMKQKAKLAVDFGDWFGQGGQGHIRINLATTPANIEKAVRALIVALQDWQK